MEGSYSDFIEIAPILMVLASFVGACLSAIPFIGRKARFGFSFLFMGISLMFSLFIVIETLGKGVEIVAPSMMGDLLPLNIRADVLSAIMSITVSVLCASALAFGFEYNVGEINKSRDLIFYPLIMLLATGLLGVTVASDLLSFWVFMELAALSAYSLVSLTHTADAYRAALRYLIMGSISSLMIMLGIGVLYSVTGTLDMSAIKSIIWQNYETATAFALACCVSGLLIKSAQFPAYLWMPQAHAAAITPISAIHSGVVAKLGFFGIARFMVSVFGLGGNEFVLRTADILCFLGIISILYAGFMALMQEDLELVLAYSTISHAGMMVLGFATLTASGISGAFFHLIDDALAKAAMFMSVGVLIWATGKRRLSEVKGLGRKYPLVGTTFLLAMLSLVGVPPTAGFISKFYLVKGSFEADKPIYGVVIILGALLAMAYALRVLLVLLSDEGEEVGGERRQAPFAMNFIMLLLAVSTWVIGAFAVWIIPAIEKYVRSVM